MMRLPRAALVALSLASILPSGCQADEKRPVPRVVIESAGGPAAVQVEVARTPAQQRRGLMNRPELDADAGMIFVFDRSERHSFWMKNTLIALDMLFIGDDGRVAAIVGRDPLGEQADDGGVDSRYVLEVNRGWSARHGVKVGDAVKLENVLY